MNIQGNTILVTGGGSGIGRALAHRFHDLGNRVIVAGRRREALDETIAGRPGMTAIVADVGDAAGIVALARQVTAEHPALNILVNNAGIMRGEDPTAARDLADAERTVATNLLGPIRLIDALVDHLGRQPDAAIINVTSGLAFVPMAGTPTYSATKAALHSYTLSLRARLRGRIEVIELAPPGVQTDLTPGQADRPGFLPLDAFIDETMALFRQQPTPAEILVERVRPLRHAEAEGRFDQVFATVNGTAPAPAPTAATARIIPNGEPIDGGMALFEGPADAARDFLARCDPDQLAELSVWTSGHLWSPQEFMAEPAIPAP